MHDVCDCVVRREQLVRAPRSADSVDKPAVNDKPVVKKAPKPSASKAKPDKNQYWLLYPTPPDQMRSFSTDRPTKSNVPYTVDAGHFQYETDLVNYTHQVTGSTHTDTLLVPNPTFKVGLTNNADLEVNVPFAGVHTFTIHRPDRRARYGASATPSCAQRSTCGETMAAILRRRSYRMSKRLQLLLESAMARWKAV